MNDEYNYKEILKSIKNGNLAITLYSKHMMNKGVELGYYTRALLIETVLSRDKKELHEIISKIHSGKFNPKNIWVSTMLSSGLERELIEQKEIDKAVESYKLRKR